MKRRTVGRATILTVTAATVPGCAAVSSSPRPASSPLESATRIHEAASAGTVQGVADTTTVQGDSGEYRLQEGGVKWETTPVETVVGIETAPAAMNGSAGRDAIEASYETWNGVSDVPDVFAPPVFDDSLADATDRNGVNELVWTSLGDHSLGEATIYWNPDTNRLQEVDIRLNLDKSWSTDPQGTSDFDVQSVATHEIGHHGLDDLTDPDAAEQTMYHKTAPAGTKKRTLAAGDIAGWRVVYRSSN